ncbi:SprT family protein [Lysinibacillus odysseyi]|uniref:Protein SprT-like n=1 Tax=Lysinibacillus odysseyi 34hs-1 = NBRC 100172 TaxID=1220589 RepID=A0A0A3IRE9_9BACI|nr:SprT family protein [Lysinibacillus odysseyi]KGR86055.1 hypothetical protein CD32_06550 [Lysinibacillus odysseyi 34hs-1 = NBRC 100172]
MSDEQVQRLVEELSITKFGMPFLHKAYFNKRLKTTGGRYLLRSHNIELNKKLYDHFGEGELQGIILHELCHYHLHIRGLGYKHRDQDFRKLLKKVGAPRFCSTIETEKKKHKQTIHTYICMKCHQLYRRKRKMDTSKYCCGKCKGKLIYEKSEVTEEVSGEVY